jgi:hypothetical protein
MRPPKRLLVLLAALLVGGQAIVASANGATTVNVTPDMPATVGNNCYPFGLGGIEDGNTWTPFMGFVYKDVPAFQLKTGDKLAFDLVAMNDVDVQVKIEVAPTTGNGGDTPSLPFTTVVTNSQTPTNPRGDTTLENYELGFTAEAPFNFSGGGLIIRFSDPSASYLTDTGDGHCDGVLGGADSTDPSGFFVERYFTDTDGVTPYDDFGVDSLAGFRLTLADIPPTAPPAGPTGQPPTTKKKCKKKGKRKSSVSTAKKKRCKKKKKR